MHWTPGYRWPMLCVAPRSLGAKEVLMGRIGKLLLGILGLASARFTDDLAPAGSVASPRADERPLRPTWGRCLGSLTAAPARPPVVPMKIAVSDVRADVLVSLSLCDERSKRRCR
jgi:hypothetical protein